MPLAYGNLKCSAEFSRHNFVPRDYVDERGKPLYSVTKTMDGFTTLAMGVTGPKASAFKEAYIAIFNAMATALSRAIFKPLSIWFYGRQLGHPRRQP